MRPGESAPEDVRGGGEGGVLDELVKAWRTNQRIHLYLIDNISDAGMRCSLSKHGGRDVALQFAHIHNVRVWHLERRAKHLARELAVFPPKISPPKAELVDALSASAAAVESFLAGLLANEPGHRGFRKGVFTTLAYFVAHESHHRGNILLTLKECGHRPDKKVHYAIWNWDRL